MNMLQKFDLLLHATVFRLDSLFRLIPRIVIGGVFIPAGWSKLQSMAKTIDFFNGLGIPLPSIVAPVTSLAELTFGFFVFVGFYTRVSTVPLLMIMAGAVMTAHQSEFNDFNSLLTLEPALYFVILICTLSLGAGRFSVEQIFSRKR